MPKRLHVLMPDDEFGALRAMADSRRMTVSEFVRVALRDAVAARSSDAPDRHIAAIRRAFGYQFPAPDIDEMLREIELGYRSTPPGSSSTVKNPNITRLGG